MAKKILVIDDDHLVVKSLARLLEGEGYIVSISETGQEAIELTEQNDFNLIISDIRMPNINGIETIRIINESLRKRGRPGIPVIFITGYADDQNRELAQSIKAADFLYKPFDKNEFLKSIIAVIGA